MDQKVYADRKPRVSEVGSWDRIFHNEGVSVYEASNYYDYYKVVTSTKKTKYFFGETAWMNTQRFAVDHSDFSAYSIF
jgi:hypothetical protein